MTEYRTIWRWQRDQYLAAGWTVWGAGYLRYQAARDNADILNMKATRR